jgi:serine/threonine protein kinase/Tol biopolymer transport system component
MTLTSGSRLGTYEILAPIGAGGMGEVYRARDSKLGRDVAVKVLPEAFARDPERMARFQREAKVLASLNHPNIASIYGLEDSSTTHALVMELIEGPTLADRIKSGPIPIGEALLIAKQICDALEYAHERGIVHRDLKPANVKVTNDNAVKVLDFGLAKAIEGDASSTDISNSPTMSRMATLAGVLLGTAAYMSPEQAKGKSADRRADIWAFGCVLYEMLTGKMAFQGESVTDTLAAVIRAEPDGSQLPAATPVRVRTLLQRCLQKDPKQRLQAIGDARIALEEILSGAPDPSTAETIRISAPLWRRALPWAVAALLFVTLTPIVFVHLREKPLAQAEPVRFEIPVPDKATMSTTGSYALSPDGRQLAFAATGADGVLKLWIRSLDSLDVRTLPGSEAPRSSGHAFFWSPDSRYIAFDAGGKLKKINVSGGTAETLCDSPAGAIAGSWGRDGVIIFAEGHGGIMRVSAAGGTATLLTGIDPSRNERLHDFPSFLPDGLHFTYLRISGTPENSGVYIGSVDAKPTDQNLKRVMAADDFPVIYVPTSEADSGQMLFVRDASLLAQPFDTGRMELTGEPITVAEHVRSASNFGFFSASANDVLVYRTAGVEDSQLTWFDREGKILGTEGERSVYGGSALSPNGMRAAVGRYDAQSGKRALWLVDFLRGASTRFTFGSSSAYYPIWSPDGSRLIFASDASGIFDLYQKPPNGATDEQLLLKSSETKVPSSLSRDGRFLLYFTDNPKTQYDLWVLPLEGDEKPFPFLQTEFNEMDGHFSPDDHWVAYMSDESGRYEIYVRKFSPDPATAASDNGGKWQISYEGGTEPRWSADGKDLYYLTPDSKVMAVEVNTNPGFQSGTPKLLFQAPPQQSNRTTGDYTVDGKRFLLLAPVGQTGQAPFTVVLNWQGGLKK